MHLNYFCIRIKHVTLYDQNSWIGRQIKDKCWMAENVIVESHLILSFFKPVAYVTYHEAMQILRTAMFQP